MIAYLSTCICHEKATSYLPDCLLGCDWRIFLQPPRERHCILNKRSPHFEQVLSIPASDPPPRPGPMIAPTIRGPMSEVRRLIPTSCGAGRAGRQGAGQRRTGEEPDCATGERSSPRTLPCTSPIVFSAIPQKSLSGTAAGRRSTASSSAPCRPLDVPAGPGTFS
jgi:hypothetical protein